MGLISDRLTLFNCYRYDQQKKRLFITYSEIESIVLIFLVEGIDCPKTINCIKHREGVQKQWWWGINSACLLESVLKRALLAQFLSVVVTFFGPNQIKANILSEESSERRKCKINSSQVFMQHLWCKKYASSSSKVKCSLMLFKPLFELFVEVRLELASFKRPW